MMLSMTALFIFLAAIAGFWLLYGLVVCARLVDEGIVPEEHEWDPILYHWPTAQLRAYRGILTADETNRWFNWYLFNAARIIRLLALVYALTLIEMLLLQ
jgi:hypothetical protein